MVDLAGFTKECGCHVRRLGDKCKHDREREKQAIKRNAEIAEAARWYVECAECCSFIYKKFTSNSVNIFGYWEACDYRFRAYADLRALCEGE